jgi:16S rRNA processing protein RimM
VSSNDTDPPLFEVGRVVKPHGLNGEVSVFVQTDRPEVRFAAGAELLVGGSPMTVANSRPHQGRWLVRFEGVGDRGAAEGLRQRQLEAPALPGDDDSDTFWVHELVGLTVVTEDSEDLGDVVGVIELPSSAGYDLLEVRRVTGETWFLPAADDLVEAVETEDGDLVLVVVDPPAGLVDEAEQLVVRPANQSGTDAGTDA